jgi:PA14 domain/Dolichyl-phosphate-mannose-protein mannosyltransferase
MGLRRLLLVVSTILIGVAAFERLDPVREGLNATYFTDVNWSSTPALSRVESQPSSNNFRRAWSDAVPEDFSVTWSGKLVILRGGTYTFSIDSDDGSSVYVDQQLLIDNPGRHETQRKSATIALSRGDHDLFIKYFQAGGPATLELSWASDGSPLTPIPSWAFVPRNAQFRRLAMSVVVRRLSPVLVATWLAVVVLAILADLRQPMRRLRSSFAAAPELLALSCVVAASLLLSVVGVWWGIPSEWAGDEIGPVTVLNAIEHRFSGGWFDRYPPLQMEVLSVVFSPLLILQRARLFHLSEVAEFGALLLLSRLVSIAAAAGTIVAVFRAGREAFGNRQGLLAAAAFALVTPFLYYAKTANPEVPYVFWFAVSLIFYIRLNRTLALRDFLGFALAGTLSVCTKDQAYGLYLLTPLAVAYRLWEAHRSNGSQRPLFDAITDRRLWIAGGAALVLFSIVHNIVINPSGFLAHVRDITGPGQQGYQMVDTTIPGRMALARIVADLNQRSWGWPLWIAAIAGLALAIAEQSTRRVSILLSVVALSYYIGFINVVRYAFDRYLLPICVIEALFVGFVLDRLLRASQGAAPRVARASIAIALLYTGLYAGTVDVLMVRDGRYAAEQWLRSRHAGRLVGTMFPVTVLPRLRDFDTAEIRNVSDLHDAKPAFFLLNADYARAVPGNRPEAVLAAGLQQQTLGYRLAFRSHAPAPWPWLPSPHPNLVGPRDEVPVLSVLTQVNPAIEIYERDPHDNAR